MDKYIYLWIHSTPTFFIHSFVDGHFDCFHILAIVNSAAYEHWDHAYFFFFTYTHYIYVFTLLFISGCTGSLLLRAGFL